jgi:hypothetical protein
VVENRLGFQGDVLDDLSQGVANSYANAGYLSDGKPFLNRFNIRKQGVYAERFAIGGQSRNKMADRSGLQRFDRPRSANRGPI